MDLAPHDVDFICWVLQDIPEEIYSAGSSSIAELADAGVIDTASIHIRFRKGTLCSIMMSRGATYGYDQRVEFFGTEGMCAGELLSKRIMVTPKLTATFDTVENVPDNSSVILNTFGQHSPPLMTSFPQRFDQAFKASSINIHSADNKTTTGGG